MKNFIILLALIMIASCAFPPIRRTLDEPVLRTQEPVFVPLSSRMDQCVEKYIKMDLNAQEALETCSGIHKKK